ncbi:MAG: hypothetical protein ACYC7E_12670 [Armatimonadota bacterium]
MNNSVAHGKDRRLIGLRQRAHDLPAIQTGSAGHQRDFSHE